MAEEQTEEQEGNLIGESPADLATAPADWAAQLAAAEQRAENNLAGWQRATADYANLKKETAKQTGEIMAWANAAVMAEILPIYNHFKLALHHAPPAAPKESWVSGLAQIQKQFQGFLKKYKIEEIKTVGEPFNPEIHEAVTHEENSDFAPEIVFEEIQPGYLLEGKLLNPAKVKVAK